MIGAEQVVVDGLGHAHTEELVPPRSAGDFDPMDGVHGIVAADQEEVADVVALEQLENAWKILVSELVPAGAQGG